MILKSIGLFLGRILLGCNGVVAILMLLCAFSPYINPTSFPILSSTGLAFPIFLLLNILFLFFWIFFYRRYALLPLATMIICFGQIRTYIPINLSMTQIPDDAIKVLSYNIMHFDGHKPHSKNSPNEIVQYLQKTNADIVCLQEANFNNSDSKKFLSQSVFRKAMAEYPYFNQYAAKGNGWICLSRYPILSAQMIDYESTGNGSMAYELKVGADTLLLINNHLESNKLTLDDRVAYREMIVNPQEEALKSTSKRLIGKVSEAASIRANQANKVSQYIRESGHKYVVSCGDFNDSPLSYAHRIIGEGMNDAFIESGNGLGISYHRNGFYFRIDHILASDNIELYNCKIDNSIKASDHYPIWCYIRKK